MAPRVIQQGEIVTQIRISREDAERYIRDGLAADNVTFPEPDFGEGEDDRVLIDIRRAADNTVEARVGGGLELAFVLVDVENDPVEVPEDTPDPA